MFQNGVGECFVERTPGGAGKWAKARLCSSSRARSPGGDGLGLCAMHLACTNSVPFPGNAGIKSAQEKLGADSPSYCLSRPSMELFR